MATLKEHHHALLADLIRLGGMPASELDGRVLRPLKAAGLVTERSGRVEPTLAGRGIPAPGSSWAPVVTGAAGTASLPLSRLGSDTLRVICRQQGGVPSDHIDGRVRRALLGRGFVTEKDGSTVPTDSGRGYYQEHIRRRRRSTSGFDPTTAGTRAAVLLNHVARLEEALPAGVELMVGDMPCNADYILAALRSYAHWLAAGRSFGAAQRSG